jgi:hypothetical protein
MKVFIIGILACLTLTCCKKQKQIPNLSGNYKSKQTYVSKNGRSPANSSNPFDDVGYKHNLICDHMAGYLNGNPTATLGNICDEVENYEFSEFNIEVSIDPNDIENITSPTDANSTVQNYLDDLQNIVDGIPDYSAYSDYKTAVVSLESLVMNNAILTDGQKEKVLSAASVARYSADYWWDFDPPGNPNSGGRLKDCVAMDIAGSSIGSLTGNSHATAATASVWRALSDLIDWF